MGVLVGDTGTGSLRRFAEEWDLGFLVVRVVEAGLDGVGVGVSVSEGSSCLAIVVSFSESSVRFLAGRNYLASRVGYIEFSS